MRAVVMENTNDNQIIVLTKNGEFKKIKKPSTHIEVGMEIDITNPLYNNVRRIAAMIVIVILMSGFGASAYAYYTPYGYVSLNINPSMEIIYNRFNRVLKVNGTNEDGKNLVSGIESYKHHKLNEMIGELVGESILYIEDEEIDILITHNKTIDNQTLNSVKEAIDESYNKVNIYTKQISTSEYEKAKSSNMSPGKAILIKKIKEINPNYSPKQLEQKSMKELIKMSNEKSKLNKEKNSNKQEDSKQQKKNDQDSKKNSSKDQSKRNDSFKEQSKELGKEQYIDNNPISDKKNMQHDKNKDNNNTNKNQEYNTNKEHDSKQIVEDNSKKDYIVEKGKDDKGNKKNIKNETNKNNNKDNNLNHNKEDKESSNNQNKNQRKK